MGAAYGTKMAVAEAWVSFMASATFLKTGSPRCSVPAFLGFVPPTTLVPAVMSDLFPAVSKRPSSRAHTVFNRLLCVEASCVLASFPMATSSAPTHVPCFPVKPWNRTLVSPLMRRFLIVSAYCEEAVAYCLVAAFESAERSGWRIDCIVTVEWSRKQIWGIGRVSRVRFVGG